VDAVLGVNSRSWQGEVERDDLSSCSPVMVELWTRKKEIGDGDWDNMGGYEGMWEIRGTTCRIGFRIPRIGVRTCWIGCHACCIGAVPAVSGIVN